ncbi:hypothetical protein F4861DRAFT_236580 [Xylaria intraflava]|nr:hypothetical protein F4861DRAFT_236580 [Xylaria intraflava]
MASEKTGQAVEPVYRRESHEAGPRNPGFGGPPEDELEPEPTLAQQQPLQPPPYSGPSSSATDSRRAVAPKGPQYYPGLPILDYRLYSPSMFELSADSITITSKTTLLSEDAKALSSLIRKLATVPPKPQILIQGSQGGMTEFRVQLNLMSLLLPDNPRARMDYLRCVTKGEMAYRGGREPSLTPELRAGEDGLEAWCMRYVKDQSPVKTFTLERVVANFDQNWLEGQIRSLVASINYQGMVTVQFPLTHAKVTVQNPDKVNKFFTSVTTLFSGKAKYEVVKSVWPFANAKNGENNRRPAVQSEETWWEEWKDPIKYAILQRRQGWVTNEDKLECIMEGKAKGAQVVDWGLSPTQ